MGLIEELGELALATRLRRLADRLQHDVSRLYKERSVPIQSRWFPVLFALARYGRRSVSDLAQDLGLSHTAIKQIDLHMARAGLVVSETDPDDRRRRVLSLSPAGEQAAEDIASLWDEVRAATRDLLAESGHDVLRGIAEVERLLDERSMLERVRERLAASLKIVDYRPAFAVYFRALNLAWLEGRFEVEDEDLRVLRDPQGEVVDRGGSILFATFEGEVVGTCAVLRRSPEVVEIAKMAVDEPFRGRGFGRRLARAAIARARELGARKVVLLTSPRLVEAGRLYRSLGFVEDAEADVSTYARASIALSLDLEPPG